METYFLFILHVNINLTTTLTKYVFFKIIIKNIFIKSQPQKLPQCQTLPRVWHCSSFCGCSFKKIVLIKSNFSCCQYAFICVWLKLLLRLLLTKK